MLVKTAHIFLFLLIFSHYIPAKDSIVTQPKLQMLTRSQVSDSTVKSDDKLKITSDSAKIITPQIRSVISENFVPIEILPRCAVDSVTILVRYSGKKIDTLSTYSCPPYKAVWSCEKVPDQDQIHLQVGYILFLKSGLKIISPPLAHRWVLDRKKEISRKKYHSYQNDAPDTSSIDGVIDNWKGARTSKIGNTGNFKVLWTGSHIFLAARIFDSSVTYKDFVEFHFDLHNNKSEFAGINHRSIRFGPKLRSNCFTAELTDSGFILADSVNVLLSREMRWAKKIYSDGYSIEVSLPIFVLSDLQYPGKIIGFDVSVIDVDEGSENEAFTSWAGTEQTNRYNPSQWGNLVLVQAMYPIRLAFIIGAILFSITIVTIITTQIFQYYKSRKFEQAEQTEYSDIMEQIIFCTKQKIADPKLSSSEVAIAISSTTDEVNDRIIKEAGCTFEQFVNIQKVKLSRALLRETDYTLDKIAEMTGFKSAAEFNSFFTDATHSDPQKYRERKKQEAELEKENGDQI